MRTFGMTWCSSRNNRKKAIYGKVRRQLGEFSRRLVQQRESGVEEEYLVYFLGSLLPCVDGRSGQAGDSDLYPGAGTGRSWARTAAVGTGQSPVRWLKWPRRDRGQAASSSSQHERTASLGDTESLGVTVDEQYGSRQVGWR